MNSALKLTPAQQLALDDVCSRFEAELQARRSPCIEDFLKDTPMPNQAPALRELLVLEWTYRKERGEPISVQEYQDRFREQTEVVNDTWAEFSVAAAASGGGDSSNSLKDETAANITHDPRAAAGSGGYDISLTEFLAPSQAADELGRLGNYRILKILGHGGMGVVYQAEDTKLKRLVALKAMLPTLAASASAGKRFLREAEAMAAVEHDHIVRIYQIDEDRGVPYMAMEFLKGESLDQRLKRDDKLPLREVLRVGREIAEALAAAHARDLIHRDIKPGNIWLEARSHDPSFSAGSQNRGGPNPAHRVKILDFGLARAASQDSGLTQQGAIIGTPAYMAPEQGRGEAVDARCDLFSLGVVLYRLATGQQPFSGKDTVSALMSVAMHEPPPPNKLNFELPQEFSDLVMKLLEKDPAKRIASAGEVVNRLDAVAAVASGRDREIATIAVPLTAVPMGAVPGTDPDAASAAGSGVYDPRRRKLRRLQVSAGLLLTALLAGGAYLAGIIRIGTDQGDYVIATDDPDFSFSVSKGTVKLTDKKTGRTYDMKVAKEKNGVFELDVTDVGADLSFTTKEFTIKRGQQVALKAHFERHQPAAQAKGTPVDDAWIKMVQALPAEKQVEAVVAKLKELNPGFDGKVTPVIDKAGVVTGLLFLTDNVMDISPVRALTGLRTFRFYGTQDVNGSRGQLADLSPLKGLKLNSFAISCNKVSDLSALGDMPLETLDFQHMPVSDLRPLRNMKLVVLLLMQTKVKDISPLKGMPLVEVNFHNTPVSDLAPLKEIKSLQRLSIHGTNVSDLSPLKDLQLSFLSIRSTKVSDVSPLKGMSIKELYCDFRPENDAAILRSIKTLETINGQPAAEFWKAVDAAASGGVTDAWLKQVAALPAQEQVDAVAAKLKDLNPGFDTKGMKHKVEGDAVTQLELITDEVANLAPVRALPKLTVIRCSGTASGKGKLTDLSPLQDMALNFLAVDNQEVADLAPLRGMPLVSLYCSNSKVADLTPLRDLPLSALVVPGTRVSDLSPLKGMKLSALQFDRTQVTDLSPLRGMPLSDIHCDFRFERDGEILRSMKDLATINGSPAAEFWKRAEAQQAAFDAWLKQVAALPAKEQVDAVAAKLKELNPGFDGKIVSHTLDGNVVTSLYIFADHVTNLAPLRALLGLTTLTCIGSAPENGKLADLSPLKELPLSVLDCNGTQVADLAPLRGMKLKFLSCNHTRVSEIAPLKGMPIAELRLGGTAVADLKALRGMPLATLTCWHTKITDLSPLKDSPLKELDFGGTTVADLTPLKELKLTKLWFSDTKVTDLSPLKKLPLIDIRFDFRPERDAAILRSIKTLETINGQPAAEFWKRVDAGIPEPAADTDRRAAEWVFSIGGHVRVDGSSAGTRDPAALPQKPFRLTHVNLDGAQQVNDATLANLQDCKNLLNLTLIQTNVGDAGLAHLKNCLTLEGLHLANTKVTDAGLPYLKDCKKLVQLNFMGTKVSDAGLAHFKSNRMNSLALGGPEITDAGLAYFKDCTELEGLALEGPTLSDAGLVHFAVCKKLGRLMLDSANITDVGLANFKDCKNLADLVLIRTQATDAGLANFKNCKNLLRLIVNDCAKVTDAGLAHFKDCKNLAYLDLRKTQVAAAKIDELKKALPKCRIEWDGGVIDPQASVDEAWLKQVAALPAKEQVDAVAAKLKDLNPGFDGKVTHTLDSVGRVSGLVFSADHVTEIAPVRALADLRTLKCDGSARGKGQLVDLSPLKDMKLTQLFCNATRVTDLTPLKDMKLQMLQCRYTNVSDLTPLKNVKLEDLSCDETLVTDLTPLKGMSVRSLNIEKTKVSDLTPLQDSKLVQLNCRATQVTDLTPLRGLPLTSMDCRNTRVTDLEPLRGMPLTKLFCDFAAERDAAILRSIKTLETINGQPAAEFWKKVDSK